MKKILVTTDFSKNSRAGIRFALQLASQIKEELIFYNVIQIMKPTIWKQEKWDSYVQTEIEQYENKLNKLIETIYKPDTLSNINYKCVCEVASNVDTRIIDFAKKINANYICMSTRGAGNIEKIFGSIAASLITISSIPIIVVPNTYRLKPIEKIWYISDFENFQSEITVVSVFNETLKAQINVTHYHTTHSKEEIQNTEVIVSKNQSKKVTITVKQRVFEYSLIEQIQSDLKEVKPSILVLFSNQNRNWLERLFLSSKANMLSFNLKTPMLVFKKISN